MEKIVIVGSGPAGLTAALYTARAGLAPLVIEGIQPGGQLTTTTDVENYPGFVEAIGGSELVDRMRQQACRFGARCVSLDEVVSATLKTGDSTLTLSGGDQIHAMSVIIATGASAIYLGLDSETKLMNRGVSACATCDAPLYRNKTVAVVGGGDTAMEDASFLTRIVSKVTLIHRRNDFRASKIMADRVKANPKIEIIWDTVVTEVLDVSKGKVTGLALNNVRTGVASQIAVDGVFMAIGHKPNTDAFKGQIDLDEKGFIVTVNSRTSMPGVFAAGDVQDPHYKQAVTAAGTGCMAAIEAEHYLASLNS